MKHQLDLFWTALMFYTRLPCPKTLEYSEEKLNKATRFFPLIGWIVGLISFTFFYVAQWVLPLELSIIISLAAGILTTGAFHEDGFADFFDGFGGGWTKDKILDIMKDSRVGTYGMVASILLFAAKFYCLLYLIPLVAEHSMIYVLLLFVGYHALSRFTAIQLCFLLDYVRDDEKSKAKPIAKKQTITEKISVVVWGWTPMIGLSCIKPELNFVIIPLMILVFYFKNYLNKWIGGYTGDCLGAVEQMAEVLTLATFLALWNFTL